LGQSFSECIINGQNLSNEELYKLGINSSTTHIDFMIGTKDLQITAKTRNGDYVEIFTNGNFNHELVHILLKKDKYKIMK
ncbi:MAG: aminopeptidase, partial [Bacilli bacterium]|nr:aminopeptidase [Bacilli bacterium]